jgi:hypothetical protein
VNRLIGLLEIENDLTVGRLKKVYRALCKRTHPDLAGGLPAHFVELRREYEEALEILTGRTRSRHPSVHGAAAASAPWTVPAGDPRTRVLHLLHLYAVRFYGSDSGRILSALTGACRVYDAEVHSMLLEYWKVFFDGFHSWVRSGIVYYTHNLLIASIMQLGYCRSISQGRHGILLAAYLQDMEKRAGKLPEEQRRILASFGSWLRREAAMEKETSP